MKKDKKIEEPKPQAIPVGIDVGAEKAKYMAEFQELTEKLKIVDAECSKRVSLETEREMLMLALAERKGIIAYLNSKGA